MAGSSRLVPRSSSRAASSLAQAKRVTKAYSSSATTEKFSAVSNGAHPQLIPESKMKAFQPPPKTLPRSPGNEREWLNACKGSKEKPGGHFEFSGMVTETLLLGHLATRAGDFLTWDRPSMSSPNFAQAAKWARPDRRPGWEL